MTVCTENAEGVSNDNLAVQLKHLFETSFLEYFCNEMYTY
jgi:hypothetical protein